MGESQWIGQGQKSKKAAYLDPFYILEFLEIVIPKLIKMYN